MQARVETEEMRMKRNQTGIGRNQLGMKRNQTGIGRNQVGMKRNQTEAKRRPREITPSPSSLNEEYLEGYQRSA